MKNIEDSRLKYKIVIADDHALVRGGLELVVKMAVPNTEIFQANSFDETINILNENFSIENGLLTPTMKVKRNKVIAKYKNVLENFYKN